MANPWDLPEVEDALTALKAEAEADRFLRGPREKAPAPTDAVLRFNALLDTIRRMSRPGGKVLADLPPPLPAHRSHIWADLYFPLLKARLALSVLTVERRRAWRSEQAHAWLTAQEAAETNQSPPLRTAR